MIDIYAFYPEEPQLRGLLETHSEMVTQEALAICDAHAEVCADRVFIREAGMLHDIGIVDCDAPSIYCYGDLPYICHGVAGSDRLRKAGYPRHALVCERHTGSGITCEEIIERGMPLPRRDMLPESVEEQIICYADKFYSKSGDPRRRKSLSSVIKSMSRHGRKPLERFLKLHIMFG